MSNPISDTAVEIPFESAPKKLVSNVPLLDIRVDDTEETRTFLLDIISEDDVVRAYTENALIAMLRGPLIQYARDQAVQIKQGKR